MRTFLIRAAAATALALPLTGVVAGAASAATAVDHSTVAQAPVASAAAPTSGDTAQVHPGLAGEVSVAAGQSAKTKQVKSGSEEPREEDTTEASKVAVGGGLLAIGGAGIVYAMRRTD